MSRSKEYLEAVRLLGADVAAKGSAAMNSDDQRAIMQRVLNAPPVDARTLPPSQYRPRQSSLATTGEKRSSVDAIAMDEDVDGGGDNDDEWHRRFTRRVSQRSKRCVPPDGFNSRIYVDPMRAANMFAGHADVTGVSPSERETIAREWESGTISLRVAQDLIARYMTSGHFCAIDVPDNGSCFFLAIFGAYWRNLTGDLLLNDVVRRVFSSSRLASAPGASPWLAINTHARRLELSRLAPVDNDVVRTTIARACTIAMRLYAAVARVCLPRAAFFNDNDDRLQEHAQLLLHVERLVAHYRALFYDCVAYSLALWSFVTGQYRGGVNPDDTTLLYGALQSLEHHMRRQTEALQVQLASILGEHESLLSYDQRELLADVVGRDRVERRIDNDLELRFEAGQLATACRVQTVDLDYAGANIPSGYSIWSNETLMPYMADLLRADIFDATLETPSGVERLQSIYSRALGDNVRAPTPDLDVADRDVSRGTPAQQLVYLTSVFVFNPHAMHYYQGVQPRFADASLWRENVTRPPDYVSRLIVTSLFARGLLENDDDARVNAPFAANRALSPRAGSPNAPNAFRESMLPHATPETLRSIMNAIDAAKRVGGGEAVQQWVPDDVSSNNDVSNRASFLLEPLRETTAILARVAMGPISSLARVLQAHATDYVFPCLHLTQRDVDMLEALRAADPQPVEMPSPPSVEEVRVDPRYRVFVDSDNAEQRSERTLRYVLAKLRTVPNVTTCSLYVHYNNPASLLSAVDGDGSDDARRYEQFVLVTTASPCPSSGRNFDRYPVVAADLVAFTVRNTVAKYERASDKKLFSAPSAWPPGTYKESTGDAYSNAESRVLKRDQPEAFARMSKAASRVRRRTSNAYARVALAVANGDNLKPLAGGYDAISSRLERFELDGMGTSFETRLACSPAEYVTHRFPRTYDAGANEPAMRVFSHRFQFHYLFTSVDMVCSGVAEQIGSVLHRPASGDFAPFESDDRVDCPVRKRPARLALVYDNWSLYRSRDADAGCDEPLARDAEITVLRSRPKQALKPRARPVSHVFDRCYLLAPTIRLGQSVDAPPLFAYQTYDGSKWLPIAWDAPTPRIAEAALALDGGPTLTRALANPSVLYEPVEEEAVLAAPPAYCQASVNASQPLVYASLACPPQSAAATADERATTASSAETVRAAVEQIPPRTLLSMESLVGSTPIELTFGRRRGAAQLAPKRRRRPAAATGQLYRWTRPEGRRTAGR